jgi:hypothetical protein
MGGDACVAQCAIRSFPKAMTRPLSRQGGASAPTPHPPFSRPYAVNERDKGPCEESTCDSWICPALLKQKTHILFTYSQACKLVPKI